MVLQSMGNAGPSLGRAGAVGINHHSPGWSQCTQCNQQIHFVLKCWAVYSLKNTVILVYLGLKFESNRGVG